VLLTLHFHPALQSMTGVPVHTFDVSNLSSIKDALNALFPKLRRYIKTIMSGSLRENLSLVTKDRTIINKSDYHSDILKHNELWLIPIIEGSGGKGFLGILLGIVLIAAAFFFLPAGVGMFTAAGLNTSVALGGLVTVGGLLQMGIGLVLTGLMSVLMKPPGAASNSNSKEQRSNDMFGALQNTTDTNASVPLIYGRPRVAGQILSLHVETINHGENDTIYVTDLFHNTSNEIEKTG
jgi:predicted phage tail protein